MATFDIVPEQAADIPAIDAVHRRAFGADGGKIIALLADLRARATRLRPISLVARRDGDIVGHVLLSQARLDAPNRIIDVLTLSPLAVNPAAQGSGIGTALIAAGLRCADEGGVPLVFLEGDPAFYASRGFSPAGALGFRSPSLRIPDAAFQVARLSRYEPAMTGTFVYGDVFWDHDAVGLR